MTSSWKMHSLAINFDSGLGADDPNAANSPY